MEHQWLLSSINKYTSVCSRQNIRMFRLHKIRPLSMHKYVLRRYWHANIWSITMFTAFSHQFLSWTRRIRATFSHPALLISTLTSPSVHSLPHGSYSFRFLPMSRMSRPLHPLSSDRPNTNCDTPHYTNPPPSVTSSLLGTRLPLSILSPNTLNSCALDATDPR